MPFAEACGLALNRPHENRRKQARMQCFPAPRIDSARCSAKKNLYCTVNVRIIVCVTLAEVAETSSW